MTQSLVLHHDEADGLSSGALTKLALDGLGLDTQLICIDKLYPEVVEDVEGDVQTQVFETRGEALYPFVESGPRVSVCSRRRSPGNCFAEGSA